MKIWNAKELLAHLKFLVLVGQDEDGELEWLGIDENRAMVEEFIKQEELKF